MQCWLLCAVKDPLDFWEGGRGGVVGNCRCLSMLSDCVPAPAPAALRIQPKYFHKIYLKCLLEAQQGWEAIGEESEETDLKTAQDKCTHSLRRNVLGLFPLQIIVSENSSRACVLLRCLRC